MARLIYGLLLVFVVYQETSSLEIFGIDFEEIKSVYEYVDKFFAKTKELQESPTLEVTDKAVALHEIMHDLKGLSRQLIHIENNEEVKLDTIVRILLDNIEVIGDLRDSKAELLKHINHVDFLYRKGSGYDTSGLFSNETLLNFASSVLSYNNNLEETTANIYSLIFPGANSLFRDSYQKLTLSFVQANYERLCDRLISEQQRMYYIFMIIIHTHLKSFATITQAYSLKLYFRQDHYRYEYGILKFMFHSRLNNYIDEFARIISIFPRDIRRCDVARPQLGSNVLQFEGLFQVVVNTESSLKKKLYVNPVSLNYASGVCEDIASDRRERFIVYGCKTLDSIKGCPAVKTDKIRRFSWWTTASETYGHMYDCPNELEEVIGSGAAWFHNDVCACSVNYTNMPLNIYRGDEYLIDFEYPRIMKISLEPQMSDIKNNMLVVGVRFIIHDNVIHLQIKQTQLMSKEHMVNATWKPVDVDHNGKTIAIHYDVLFDRRNVMNLDDVGIDPNHIVTGVRFQINKEENGYELHVHGTEIIHTENRLGASQMWFKPGEYPINQQDYLRNRVEIRLDDPDDPSSIDDYHPDPEANKFIQLQHSSLQKDGGYHTVPFLDAQPVTAEFPIPLGGIGLFHRRRDGFGGYIAPRLFTYDYVQVLNTPILQWKEFDNLYGACFRGDSNVTKSEIPSNCSSLTFHAKQNASAIHILLGTHSQMESINVPFFNKPDNKTIGATYSDLWSNHSDTTKLLPSKGGDTRASIIPTVMIPVTQPSRDHLTRKPPISDSSSFLSNELSPFNNDYVATSNDSYSDRKINSINGPLASGPDISITTSKQTKHTFPIESSRSVGESLTVQGHPSLTQNPITKNSKTFRMHGQRRYRIERPLIVLRRNKLSVIYQCKLNGVSY